MLLVITQPFRAPPEEVYAWCTDYQDSDPQLSRARLRTRRVVRREAGVVDMEETGVMGFPYAATFKVVLQPPLEWGADGRSNLGDKPQHLPGTAGR